MKKLTILFLTITFPIWIPFLLLFVGAYVIYISIEEFWNTFISDYD